MSACTCGQRTANTLYERPCPVHPLVTPDPPDLAAIRARHEYDARMNAISKDAGEQAHADRRALLAALDDAHATTDAAVKEVLLVLMAEPWWRGDHKFQEGFRLYLRAVLNAHAIAALDPACGCPRHGKHDDLCPAWCEVRVMQAALARVAAITAQEVAEVIARQPLLSEQATAVLALLAARVAGP